MNPKTPLEHEVMNMLLSELGNVNQNAIRNLLLKIVEIVERERGKKRLVKTVG